LFMIFMLAGLAAAVQVADAHAWQAKCLAVRCSHRT
jgi:hypothetical protein